MNQLHRLRVLAAASALATVPVIVGTQSSPASRPAGSAIERFRTVTDERLANTDREPENWFVYRRSPNQWAHSPLDQVTRGNVHQLQLAWATGMPLARNQQEPMVIDGVMFLLHGDAEALDARTGESLWRFHDDRDARQSAARSLAVYRDKVVVPANGTRVIGLDARTGAKAWDVETSPENVPGEGGMRGQRWSVGPQVGSGKAFLGSSCLPKAPACSVAGVDVETGKLLWRRSGVAGPGDPEEDQATWGDVPYNRREKVSFWGTGSYDPASNVTYWGSASATPYPEILRGSGEGTIKYTNSTLAIDGNTGKLKWAFQHLPRDNWDLDNSAGGRILRDNLRVRPDSSLKWFNPGLANGQVRNVIYAMGKPAILWALDRDTGEFLWAKELLYQDIYRHIDGKGRVTLNEEKIPKAVGDRLTLCPGTLGGGNYQFMAYSPLTNALVVSLFQQCSEMTIDRSSIGHSVAPIPMPGSQGNLGRVVAIDAGTGRTLWSYEQRLRVYSVLTTGGGLVFVGDEYRHLIALDGKTGQKVWEIGLGGPVMGNPISYAVAGRQYVAVMVGTTAATTATPLSMVPEIQPRYGHVTMMAFALPERPAARPR